jgi:hypothetical protein
MSKDDKITPTTDATSQEIVTNALQSIPFENLIGGPLTACVKAQEMAADATWRYIKEVGFVPSHNEKSQEAIIISFLFQQDNRVKKLSMPLLTLVPVPYISIDTIDLTFQADMSASSSGELRAKYSNNKDSKIESKYNIQNVADINIRATSCHMPAGIAKMLDLFTNNCIQVRDYEKEEVKPVDTVKTDDKKKSLIGSVVDSVIEKILPTEKTSSYNIVLTEKLTDANKGAVVGAVMKTAGDVTEEEILSRSKTTNMTIVTDVSLNKGEEIVKAIKNAGGEAQLKKI